MTLRGHQRTAVERLGNGKILYGGVGVGKSITALAYYYEKVCGGDLASIPSMQEPRDIYIITTAKKRDEGDWLDDMVKLGLVTGTDSMDDVKVTVDSWNNMHKWKGVQGAFFIFDEQRLVGSGAWTKAFIHLARRNQWILLSATPGDTWLDYIPVFVANGFYKNRTEFKRRHVVYNTYSKFPKVDRYLETGTLVRNRNRLLVHMPYERHTRRRSQDITVDFDSELFNLVKEKRWNPYEKRPIRDIAELFAVMRKVVNSDTTRLLAVQTLARRHSKLIVFYNFDYELTSLRTLPAWLNGTPLDGETLVTSKTMGQDEASLALQGQAVSSTSSQSTRTSRSHLKTGTESSKLSEKFEIAEWNGHKHQPIPTSDRWIYLVQYAAGAEGWNCIATDAMCFYSMSYSYKMWEQAHGRIDRLNTPFTDLFYYRLISMSFIDRAIAKSLQHKEDFNTTYYRELLA